ncbi:MAG TPA: phosphoglycerate dehydrogenase [Planctomycetaceae bacterium]|nr:phosphoglycerate dehydrogenase [Planctomycetaceae bacterium]
MPQVVGTSIDSGFGPHLEILQAAGFGFREVSRTRDLRRNEELIEALAGADAVIAGAEPYSPRVIEALPSLRVISRSGVGFDSIDLAACDRAGVAVCTTPGVNHHAVAELTFALLFGVGRGFPMTDRRVREGKWKRVTGPRVMGSTLGIIGLGRIGQAVATRAIGVGMNVLAFEPQPNAEFVAKWAVQLLPLDELLARSDYVSIHSPLTPDTRHLINARTLARMKAGSVLINTARGGLVDEAALCEALRSGHLRAAALDVFEVEPLPLDSPLLTFDNVLLSGHVAGMDNESKYDTFKMAAETIVALYRGRWPAECIVNLRGVDNWRWARG